MIKKLTFATVLTLFRLSFSISILPFLLLYAFQSHNFCIDLLAVFVVLLLGLTDFFDGHVARKYHQETVLGKLLDPLADKVFICSALVTLLAQQKIHFYWVIIFLTREFFVMGLRLIAQEHDFSIPVSSFAKAKTFLQILMIACYVVDVRSLLFIYSKIALLIFALICTVGSAMQYTSKCIQCFYMKAN